MRYIIGFILACLLCSNAYAAQNATPRVLLALYDSRIDANPRTAAIHNFLELPANHLGYDIHYADVMSPLPDVGSDVAGVVLWFDVGTAVPEIPPYLAWLQNVVRQHKKLLIIENPGVDAATLKDPKEIEKWNSILGYIGVQDDTSWNQFTYGSQIAYIDNKMMGFERKITPPYPPLSGFHILPGDRAVSYLRMHVGGVEKDENFDMAVTSANGGFIAQGYAIYTDAKIEQGKEKIVQEWIVNPFRFLREALNPAITPIPDNTTMDGKRIFYAHIDGDGWNNISEIEPYHANNSISSDVIYKEILKGYPQFGFSVGVISEDVDKDCFAVPTSEQVARAIFALPNVEPASHTYSHPIYWGFFQDYTPEKEKPLLKYYPPKPEVKFSAIQTLQRKLFGGNVDWSKQYSQDAKAKQKADIDNYNKLATPEPRKHNRKIKTEAEILKEVDYMPRSYACSPYNLKQEFEGSIAVAQSLSPPNKKVKLIQWPGDTSPYEEALAESRKYGLLNINGGDSRFDEEFPSYSFVAPIGIRIGKELQIYSSNSNEETYTDDWSDRFYGFRYLQATVKSTESPMRVSPFNIYFHMFSGQKLASLNAVKENLDFAGKQDIMPMTAGDYAEIAEGFFTAQIVPAGNLAWHIRNRGELGTVRFDNADDLSVNFAASRGVLGEELYQHSLYVALDPAEKDAYVALRKTKIGHNEEPYLMESSWKVSNLQREGREVSFNAQGYGTGNLAWHWKPNAEYTIFMTQRGKTSQIRVKSDKQGALRFAVPLPGAGDKVALRIRL
ncbi:MAG TPA: hypothetical protein VFT64_01015 [Rickettsiales bacterium]|nr:hypothetical protein [Rickettsiales bacterium]